jgi:4-diphosphocytidyl-2-C-methyl-D-erythritol kinase
MSGLAWPAPAKLNRWLRIIGRRADGYHLLQTVFQFLDYYDKLYFDLRSDGRVVHSNPLPSVPAEQDLCVRAALLLQQHCSVAQGVTLGINKRLPLGGGLGGGSSNAATTLLALNHYWQTGLSLDELAKLGLQLGADVPVFVYGVAAWAEGVGDRLTPLPELDQPWFVVLVPPCSVPTANVFNNPALTRDSSAIRIRALVMDADKNDCEAVVFQQYPQVKRAADWLGQYAKARLSGTGSCVFAAFKTREEAEQVLAQAVDDLFAPELLAYGSVKTKGYTGFVSQACNHSLLHQWLQKAKITA